MNRATRIVVALGGNALEDKALPPHRGIPGPGGYPHCGIFGRYELRGI